MILRLEGEGEGYLAMSLCAVGSWWCKLKDRVLPETAACLKEYIGMRVADADANAEASLRSKVEYTYVRMYIVVKRFAKWRSDDTLYTYKGIFGIIV